MEPDDNNAENPFQAPTVGEHAAPTVRRDRRAKGRDFIQVAFQFKFFGGVFLLFGLLFVRVWWLGGSLLLVGLALVVTGYGIGAYRPWGWYAGALLVLPLLAVATILALLFAVTYGGIFPLVALIVVPIYCYYIGWTLLSRAGREGYAESTRAVAAAKANPDSIAGRLYRRR